MSQYTTEQLMDRYAELSADSSNRSLPQKHRIIAYRLMTTYANVLWERNGGWNG